MNLQDTFVQIKRDFSLSHTFRTFRLKLVLEVTSSVCTFIAILTTFARIFLRRRKLWFDDACTLLGTISLIVQLGFIFTAKSPFFTAYYLIFSTFYCTVWFSRLSILLSIIRLGDKRQSRHLYGVVVLFVLLFGILVGQVFWVCEPQRRQGHHICKPARQIAILKLVSDVVSDFFLLASSLQLFIVIQDKSLRFRLSCLFSTCVITTAVSLVNSCFILKSMGMKSLIISLIEGSVSVIVSSVPVISSTCSRKRKPRRVGRTIDTTSAIHFSHGTGMQASASTSSLSETYPIPEIKSKTSPDDDFPAYEFQNRPRDHNPDSKPNNKPTHDL